MAAPAASAGPAPSVAPLPGAGAFAVLLAAALAVRAATLGNPVVHSDEQFYLAVAHAWARGALPYLDIWDRKPAGLFLAYWPAGMLDDFGAAVVAYQLVALAAAAATAWVIARLAAAAGWRAGAVPAGLLYLVWLDLAGGQGGQSPVLYNLPMAIAAFLVMRGRGRASGVAAMALAGCAFQIKGSVVFEGAWFALWLLGREVGGGIARRLGYAALLGAAAALPTVIAGGWFAAHGAGAAWWFATVTSVLRRGASPMAEQLGNLAIALAILMVPVGLAIAGWRRPGGAPAFLRGWLIAALGGFLVFGTWFDHYTLPVLVPAAVGAAAVLESGRGRWALLIGAALAGQAALAAARAERGTPDEFAALAAAVGRGPGCLYVHSGPAMLYPATDRCLATRFAYPSHLTRPREAAAIGVAPAAEVARLFARRPAVVVMGRPFRGEEPRIRAEVLRALRPGYRLAAIRPLGRDRLAVYVRR